VENLDSRWGGTVTRFGGQLTCLLATALLGCAEATAPSEPPAGVRWGVLEHYGAEPSVTVPSQAAVGSTATIIAKTWGGGCLAKGPTEVVVSDRRILIRVYDIQETADVCTMPLLSVDHSAEVLFDAPGTWQVDIQGMAQPGAKLITVRREVTVD
jgi:hypothetical protein